jgi:hypothetical protein
VVRLGRRQLGVVDGVSVAGPKHLATNIAVPSLVAGKSGLYFLPDRVLVREGKRYSDVGYQFFQAEGYQNRFIEDGRRPKDATQIDQTWQYVNVGGGPDRRYSKNPVLPVMLYGALDFASSHGLRWHLQTSRAEATLEAAKILSAPPPIAEI